MNKVKDKSFWIIIAVTVVTLTALLIGVITLTKKSEKEFYSAGYIINSTSSKTDKYYFNDNTKYKENVLEQYVFKNKDGKEVSSSKNNFIHYSDNSLSFMQKGVILDLDGFNEKLVPYYNITDKSLIEHKNGNYYVKSGDKTLIFGNFIGRISENKYIVVGKDLKIKLASSNETVTSNYFELLFVEDGVVKIDNQEASYQVVADGTFITIGDKIKINLGDKTVNYGDEKKLTLEEMTIDGSENINIESEGKIKKDNDSKEGKDGDSTKENTPGNDIKPGEGGINDQNGAGDNIKSQIKKEVSIDLIDAKIDANSLKASFQVIDTAKAITGKLILEIKNLTSGETVYTKELAKVNDVQGVEKSSLSPDCNYVITVNEVRGTTSIQHFQKTFKTESLDLKLTRTLVGKDSLTYLLDFGTSENIKSANISIYDETGKKIGTTRTRTPEDNSEIEFTELNSNTKYNVKVNSLILKNTNYEDDYIINMSDLTLKNKPILNEVSVEVSENGNEFTLKMEKPTDEDKSITKYRYEIFNAEDINENNVDTLTPVYTFETKELKNQRITVEESKLESNKNYCFRVVAEYYDNYKYGETFTILSDNFRTDAKAQVKVEFVQGLVDFNQINGTVKIIDEGCFVPNKGRVCSNKENNFSVIYYDTGGNIVKRVDIPESNIDVNENIIKWDIHLTGLTENTRYAIEVYADVDMNNGEGIKEEQRLGGFTVITKGIEALQIKNWEQNDYSYEVPISVSGEMGTTSPEVSYENVLATLTFNLYKKIGDETELLKSFVETDNIKDYYGKRFTITSSMFGIESLSELKEISGGKLANNYVIEITDAKDSGTNEFTIIDNRYVFETPPLLIMEDNISEPEILVEEITNEMTKSGNYGVSYTKNLGDSIIIGYKVTANFELNEIKKYLKGDYPVTKINFYVHDQKNRLISKKEINLSELSETDDYSTYFYLDYGTDYEIEDTEMRRGNTYSFTYDISLDTNDDGTDDALYPANKPKSNLMTSQKQEPLFKMYIDKSTSDSLTYKYYIVDRDNSIVKEEDKYYLYYTVGESEKQKVEIEKANEYKDVIISGLNQDENYNLSYSRALTKIANPSDVSILTTKFEKKYNKEDYNLRYNLVYSNFDNRLKVVLEDNELLDRISAYVLTLRTSNDEYKKIVTDISNYKCDEDGSTKCIIVDYSEISSFKGKNITVDLKAFYDTGYAGFTMVSKVGDYFQGLSLVEEKDKNNVGYIFQKENGLYVHVDENGNYKASNNPKGIGAFSLTSGGTSSVWKLNTSSMINMKTNTFLDYKENRIKIADSASTVAPLTNGMYVVNDKNYIIPKVLDIKNISTDNNTFKFTSIIPKVSSTITPLINGGVVKGVLSIDETTLNTDFVKTNGKYKFYIDIYKENECPEEEPDCSKTKTLVKTVDTSYDEISEVTFAGLDPNTAYSYKISADMNKNGEKVKVPLFDNTKEGYVEYGRNFSTLSKTDILNRVTYGYESKTNGNIYSTRELTTKAFLKTKTNFDIKYEIYDADENIEYTYTLPNENIVQNTNNITGTYIQDITGNDFVFGPNYHTLKITAVTTDLHKELELYNEKLVDNKLGANLNELEKPVFQVEANSDIEQNNGNNVYSITARIGVNDSDKVIKDGIYYVELQESTSSEGYVNACPGHENDCRAQIDILTDGVNIIKKFTNLKPDNRYVIYAYTDIYRNNVSLDENSKEEQVYVRKTQYTKSELGFSLGLVTPTAVNKNKLVLTFTGATNLENSLKGIEYSIIEEGSEILASGKIGKTSVSDTDNITFKLDSDKYPTLEILLPEGKQIGVNNSINITYYYINSLNELVPLEINGKIVATYGVKGN